MKTKLKGAAAVAVGTGATIAVIASIPEAGAIIGAGAVMAAVVAGPVAVIWGIASFFEKPKKKGLKSKKKINPS